MENIFNKNQVTMFLIKYRRYRKKFKLLAMDHLEVAIEPVSMGCLIEHRDLMVLILSQSMC